MPVYKGIFSNKTGSYQVAVLNDFKVFEMRVGDFLFRGTDMDSFELINGDGFTEDALRDFDISRRVVDKDVYVELKHYRLELKIPFSLIDMGSNKTFEVLADFNFVMEKGLQEVVLSLGIGDAFFEAKGEFLEVVFDGLQHAFKGRYRFKNCYGCLFADYSVYGQGTIGPMLCFKNQKEAYLNVSDKSDYMNLARYDSAQQEFYCCSDYEVRNRVVGYRGTVL